MAHETTRLADAQVNLTDAVKDLLSSLGAMSNTPVLTSETFLRDPYAFAQAVLNEEGTVRKIAALTECAQIVVSRTDAVEDCYEDEEPDRVATRRE